MPWWWAGVMDLEVSGSGMPGWKDVSKANLDCVTTLRLACSCSVRICSKQLGDSLAMSAKHRIFMKATDKACLSSLNFERKRPKARKNLDKAICKVTLAAYYIKMITYIVYMLLLALQLLPTAGWLFLTGSSISSWIFLNQLLVVPINVLDSS